MSDSKKILVCGAGGFIGSHLVKRLKSEGFWVRGVDLKLPEYAPTAADDFMLGDLRNQQFCEQVFDATEGGGTTGGNEGDGLE